MKTKTVLILVLVILGTFLSFSLIRQTDPLDILLKNTSNPKLKEKIRIFRKGGYQQTISYQKHDIEAIIKSAESYLGTPHQMGGLTKSGIDCSGLVMMAHKENGISLPHDGNEQARYGKILLSDDELRRGDLVFFHSTYNTDKLVTHSGIYLGDNQFIHVSSKKGASVASVKSTYWSEHFLFGTRL